MDAIVRGMHAILKVFYYCRSSRKALKSENCVTIILKRTGTEVVHKRSFILRAENLATLAHLYNSMVSWNAPWNTSWMMENKAE